MFLSAEEREAPTKEGGDNSDWFGNWGVTDITNQLQSKVRSEVSLDMERVRWLNKRNHRRETKMNVCIIFNVQQHLV